MKKLMCMTMSMFICGGIISNDCCAKAISEKKPITANKETYNLAITGFGKNIDQINDEEKQIDIALNKLKISNAEKKALLNNVKIILCKNGKSADVKKTQSTIKKCLSAVANKHESLFDNFDKALLKFKSQKALQKQENLVDDNLDDACEESLFSIYESVNGGGVSEEIFKQLNSVNGFSLFINGLSSSYQEDYKLLFDLTRDDDVFLAVLEFIASKKAKWIDTVYKKGKGSLKTHIDNLRALIKDNTDNAYVEETKKFLSELEGFIVFEWFLRHTRAYNLTSPSNIAPQINGQQDYSQQILAPTQTIVQQQPSYYPQTMELPINGKQNAPAVSVNNTQQNTTISKSSSSRSMRYK